jgi:hypothetical protein
MGRLETSAVPRLLLLAMLSSGVAAGVARAEEATAPQQPWEIGVLTCSLGQERKAGPADQGQGREIFCRFRPGINGPEETYAGTLQVIDQAKEMGEVQTIMFVVRGSTGAKLGPGLLQQTYAAEAAGAPDKQGPLIGQRTSVVLRLSSEAGDQPSMALGAGRRAMIMLVDLKLQAAPA